MQRLGDGFLVKRMIPMPMPGGGSVYLYELPNGQWQFGRGKDATVVTNLDQVSEVSDESAKADIAKWIERTREMKIAPVVEGPAPVLQGMSARDQLSHAISRMPEEAVNRILTAITQTMGPIADSITQGGQTNHYGDGFGQDQAVSTPGMVQPTPFQLPPDGQWVDEKNHAAGFYTPYMVVKNAQGEVVDRTVVRDAKGNPTKHWNPAPEFHQMVQSHESDSSIDAHPVMEYQGQEDEQGEERVSARELVGAGSGRKAGKRR